MTHIKTKENMKFIAIDVANQKLNVYSSGRHGFGGLVQCTHLPQRNVNEHNPLDMNYNPGCLGQEN